MEFPSFSVFSGESTGASCSWGGIEFLLGGAILLGYESETTEDNISSCMFNKAF